MSHSSSLSCLAFAILVSDLHRDALSGPPDPNPQKADCSNDSNNYFIKSAALSSQPKRCPSARRVSGGMSGRVLQRYAFISNILKSPTQLMVKSICFEKNDLILGGFCCASWHHTSN